MHATLFLSFMVGNAGKLIYIRTQFILNHYQIILVSGEEGYRRNIYILRNKFRHALFWKCFFSLPSSGTVSFPESSRYKLHFRDRGTFCLFCLGFSEAIRQYSSYALSAVYIICVKFLQL